MVDLITRRAGQALAGLLAADGLVHLYWATGSTWPAGDARTLSLAVLGTEVPFTPQVVLPLAAALFTASAAVGARTFGRGGRPAAFVTGAVAVGLGTRGLVGAMWALGPDATIDSASPLFHGLNLLLYTPLCLGFAFAALRVLKAPRREKVSP
ncbi:DUF3995 domain-containing protein [Streptomyces sp. NPDC088097]|uniref:DUF3995 domain-containing protein n=1 Tax=Streptomyces sp. NPDC088097 TaxID=3365823 RepID=UPI0037FCE51F